MSHPVISDGYYVRDKSRQEARDDVTKMLSYSLTVKDLQKAKDTWGVSAEAEREQGSAFWRTVQ